MASVLGLTLRLVLFSVILMLGDEHEDLVYDALEKP